MPPRQQREASSVVLWCPSKMHACRMCAVGKRLMGALVALVVYNYEHVQ